jgi:hypothetical protein
MNKMEFTIGDLTPFETACALGGLILGSCIYAAIESINQRNNTYFCFFVSLGEALGIHDEIWKETVDKPLIERCIRMLGLTCFGGAMGFISGALCSLIWSALGLIWPALDFIWLVLGLIWPILTVPLMASIIGFGASYIKIEIAKK